MADTGLAKNDGKATKKSEADRARAAAELVRRVASGESAAEGELIERYSSGLRLFLRRLGEPPEADDLHQDTFRIVLERLRRRGLENPEQLPSFLRATARNLHRAERRKRARRKTEADDEILGQAPSPHPGQLHQVLDAEATSLVRRLIQSLDQPRDRQILYRFYVAEEEKDSICADLRLTRLAFNGVLFRARQRFKDLLEDFEKRSGMAREPGGYGHA